MTAYHLADLHIGLNHSFEVQITNEMMDQFRQLTGDHNLLHIDTDFAVSQGYKDRVVYGMLVSSFYSTLVGMYLPGKFALFQGIDVSFIAPVFPGDKLVIYGEITAVHETFKMVEIKAHIINQDGKKVSRAKLKSGVHE